MENKIKKKTKKVEDELHLPAAASCILNVEWCLLFLFLFDNFAIRSDASIQRPSSLMLSPSFDERLIERMERRSRLRVCVSIPYNSVCVCDCACVWWKRARVCASRWGVRESGSEQNEDEHPRRQLTLNASFETRSNFLFSFFLYSFSSALFVF